MGNSDRPAVLVHPMIIEIIDADGTAVPIQVSFEYDSDDPFAVRIDFGPASGQGSWTFARDLLVDGFHEPSGVGDVRVFPCLDSSGTAVVVIELMSHDGHVMLQVESRDIAPFVLAMLDLVPLGGETKAYDLDAELLQILSPSSSGANGVPDPKVLPD